MEAKFYKEYYNLEREHWYFLARNRLIMHHIRDILSTKNKVKILNVGAGTGYTSELLKEFGKVESLEYDKDCCQFVSKNLYIEIVNGSILDLPYRENEFDLVCAFDVIEHIEDDLLGVSELKRVCKKGGFVVITVPAYMFLWSKHDEVNQHFRRYRKSEILNLFKEKGKFLYHSYYNFWLFFPVALFRILNNLFGFTKTTEENTGSDFSLHKKGSLISSFLFKVFYSESFFIKKQIPLPFGVSIISSWRK